MRNRLALLLLIVMHTVWASAQSEQTSLLSARANVTAYDDENGIPKLAYRDSPYYMELDEAWNQRRTDSSLVYSYQFHAEKDWKDFRVFLNVRCGRACRVSVGGKEVGYADDSRHWNEFFLSPFLKYGKQNTLIVEAFDYSQGALLEGEDIPVGINGKPYLLFKTDPNIADYTLVADYDAATASGNISIVTTLFNSNRKGKYYLEVEVWDPRGHNFDRIGRWVVFNKKDQSSVDISRTWDGVAPWSAESPSLYTAVLRLRDEDMVELETVGVRFGFRRIEIKEGLLQLNGKPLTFKGVVYHAGDADTNRSLLRQELLTMKHSNINAVRTADRSPLSPAFYELCDSLGLYVICDANLLPLSTQHRVVATDKSFIPLFLRRVENLYGRYKNHASIVAWSLGESPDNAICMATAYKHLRALDTTRPVIFAGAGQSPNTDIIALLRPDDSQLRQLVGKPSDRPFLLLASVGENNFVELENLWTTVEIYRNLQGGFVDVWPLSGSMLSDLRNLYSPFDVRLSKTTIDEAEFNVYNRSDFVDFSRYLLEYTLFTNLRTNISGGDLPVAIPADGVESVKLRIPPLTLSQGEELFLRFDLTTRQKPGSRLSPRLVGTRIIPLAERGFGKVDQSASSIQGAQSSLRVRCSLLSLRFVGHEDWRVDTVAHLLRRPDEHTLCHDYMLRYSTSLGVDMCDVRLTETFFASGDILLDYTFAPENNDAVMRPQILLQYSADSITWYGLDREVYLPTRHSGLPATVSLPFSPIHRQQVRWCALGRGGESLFISVVDHQCDLNIHHDGSLNLTPLNPPRNHKLRLHLRYYTQGSPSEYYALHLPEISGDILEPPAISANASRFIAPLAITLSSNQAIRQSDNQTIIRYTLDGTEPTEESILYTGPFTITATTVVKARLYAPGMPPSFTATRRFNYDHIAATSFSRPPSNPFNVGTDTLLFDGLRASVTDLSQGWAGFSGADLTTTVQLSKPISIDNIILRYAHAPDNWAFAPQNVTILLSTDGQHYTDTIHSQPSFAPDNQDYRQPQVVEMKIPVHKQDIRYILILSHPLRAIPSWHRAKGLKPWLLMDEIEVIEE